MILGTRKSRKEFILESLSAGAFLNLGALLGSSKAHAAKVPVQKRLVWIHMGGGWDILEVSDPKPASTAGIDMSYSYDLSHGFGIDPDRQRLGRSFGRLARQGDQLILLRGLGMGTTSHQAGAVYMDTGILANTGKVNVASVPVIVASNADSTIPMIQLAGGMDALSDRGATVSVVRAQNLELYRSMYPAGGDEQSLKLAVLGQVKSSIENLQSAGQSHDRLNHLKQAEEKIRAQIQEAVGGKLRLEAGDTEVFSQGAPNQMNRGLRDAFALTYKLLKNNLVSCVSMGVGGFDTHANQDLRLLPLLDQCDFVLSRLIELLKADGQLSQTLIVCYSDFGRTPKINQSRGRDHWPVGSAFLVGGGLKGGVAYGSTDDRLLAEPVDLNTGAFDAKGTILSPAHLGGTVLRQCLGADFVSTQRSYLEALNFIS